MHDGLRICGRRVAQLGDLLRLRRGRRLTLLDPAKRGAKFGRQHRKLLVVRHRGLDLFGARPAGEHRRDQILALLDLADMRLRRGLYLGEFGLKRDDAFRSEEPTSELQSLMRTSYAVFCLKKKTNTNTHDPTT